MVLILSIVLAFIIGFIFGCGFSMSCIAKSVKRGIASTRGFKVG